MGEIEIDLRDLFLRICIHWRKFLVFMLVGAVLLGGFAGIRSYLDVSVMKEKIQMPSDEYEQLLIEKLAKVNSELEEREIAEVSSAFQIYQDALYSYDAVLEYQENSIKMHLNPNAVPTLNVTYYVDNHYEMSYPIIDKTNNINAICNALSNTIRNEETCKKISKRLEWDKDNRYVSELISSRSADGIFYVTILAPKQEDCEGMRDIIAEMIEKQSEELKETFGDFDIVLLEESFDVRVNNDLQTIQTNQIYYMDNAKSTYRNAGSSLDSMQKESFDLLVELFEIKDNYYVEQKDDMDVLMEMPVRNYFQLKYIIVGALLGIVLFGVWVLIKYLLSTKLRVADDMENVYGVDVLAVADVKGSTIGFGKSGKKKWFRFVDELLLWMLGYTQVLDEKGAGNLASAEIVATAKKMGMKKVYIVSTACTECCKGIQKSIHKLLEKDLEIIFNEERVLESPKELERMVEYDGLVLVEECNETTYKDVKQVVACCRRNNVPIIGGIVIER